MILRVFLLVMLCMLELLGMEKVRISPEGNFMMLLKNRAYTFNQEITSIKAFDIQKYEFSVAEYISYLKALTDPKQLEYFLEAGFENEDPLTMISWDEAQRVCKYLKGRLPTQIEWMVAASIKSSKSHCYEDIKALTFIPFASMIVKQKDDQLIKCHKKYDDEFNLDESLSELNTVQESLENINGTFGMLGNVWEWVDGEVSYFNKNYKVIKGGSFTNAKTLELFDSRYENFMQAHQTRPNVGFRCVWDVEVSDTKESR